MANASVVNERKDRYVGEKQKLLRDGYGTYVYENQFFRYEGEWSKGKKHGHGKLIMKDGTFYEGQFIDGEINGNGYKYSANSQSKYTGQFLNGEMHGHGIMVYKNSNIYDGQWYRNRRQGFGVLKTWQKMFDEDPSHVHIYEEGAEPYDNGDIYEGSWVQDRRQGHGELTCIDGTCYKGQFLNDLFHGEGSISHASGMFYSGMWINGFPSVLGTKIVLLLQTSPMTIHQGQSFSIRVECRNDDDELVPETGRELQVIAGFKYQEPKEGSALFDVIEDIENKPISTPFYDVVPYPLTDQLPEVDSLSDVQDRSSEKDISTVKNDEGGEDGEDAEDDEETDNGNKGNLGQINSAEVISKTREDHPDRPHIQISAKNSATSSGTDELLLLNDQTEEQVTGTAEVVRSEEGIHIFTPVPNKPTVNGRCEWFNLQLAPPPPMYRPFVIMEEVIQPKKSRQSLTRERMDEDEEEEEEDEDKTIIEVEEMLIENFKKGKTDVSFAVEDYGEKKSSSSLVSLSKPPSEVRKSKVAEEKFVRTGEYILIVQDVTHPPFMGRKLEPAYLVLHVEQPRKVSNRKPQWPNDEYNDDTEDDFEDDEDIDKYYSADKPQ